MSRISYPERMLSRRDALRLTAGAVVAVTSSLSGTRGALASEESGWEKPRYDTANTASAPEGPETWTRELWSTRAGVVGTPVIADGKVFVSDSGGTVRALDAEDGDGLWEFEADGSVVSPVSYADEVVYATVDAVTYALDSEDGTERWKHRGRGTTNSAAVADGDVYVAKSSSVYALGFHTGTVLWEYEANGVVSATPAVVDGRVYVADESGMLHVIDADDGFSGWRRSVASSVESAPVVTDDAVYAVGTYGRVRAFERGGDELWTESTLERTSGPPAVDGDRVYVGTEEGVHALRTSNGWTDWTFEADGEATPPSLGGDTVYVGVGTTLYALDAETGEEKWRQDTPGASPPAVTEDTLYVGTNFGLSALREGTSSPEIGIADVSVEPTRVSVGETVTVTVELDNTGDADGSFILTLYADGEAVDSKEPTVERGGTEEVIFAHSFDDPGEYDLRVNLDEVATVTVVDRVKEEAESDDETEKDERTDEDLTTDGTADEDGETDNKGDGIGITPTDFGARGAVAVTVATAAVTTAAFVFKIARWYRKEDD